MIVVMKKALILVQRKDSESAVGLLHSLGVVHVEHQRVPAEKELGTIGEDIALLENALSVLSESELSGQIGLSQVKPLDWRMRARHVVDAKNRINQLQDYGFSLKNQISQWSVWGEIDPLAIKALAEKGICISLYQIPTKEIKNVPDDVILKVLSTSAGVSRCVAISHDEISLGFKEIALPKLGLRVMKERLEENNNIINVLKGEIVEHGKYTASFITIKAELCDELEFNRALRGMGVEGALVYLKGFIPFDEVQRIVKMAKREKWGIIVKDPDIDEKVPTLIRNPRWISLIKPVFKLIEVIPGYHELDISMWFLIFFSIFFGMLIGDAGIGVIFVGLTFLVHRRMKKKIKDSSAFTLLYISSGCAIIWGILTGTFFGQAWLAHSVKPLLPILREEKSLQSLCFLLGAIHLSIAHAWRMTIKLPSYSALSDLGWIFILWGSFFLAKMLVLGDAFPELGKWFIIAGMVLIVFFTSPSKNVLKGIGRGVGNLLSNVVNSFTDVVSYIRLFAVGLATVAVADSFNTMAMEVGFNSFGSALIASFILLVGHSLNIILAPMSILVHGVRLNVLEFCNHADVKWSGFAYNPLKKRNV